MARRETDYGELRARLAFADDGLPIREVGAWTLDKLALIAYYLPKFAELCTDKAHGWYFVDGFAGIEPTAALSLPLQREVLFSGSRRSRRQDGRS